MNEEQQIPDVSKTIKEDWDKIKCICGNDITEDFKYHLRQTREDAYNEGEARGREKGYELGKSDGVKEYKEEMVKRITETSSIIPTRNKAGLTDK